MMMVSIDSDIPRKLSEGLVLTKETVSKITKEKMVREIRGFE